MEVHLPGYHGKCASLVPGAEVQSALHGYCARSARTKWLGIAQFRLGTYRGHVVLSQLLVILHDVPSIDQRLHRSSAMHMKLSEHAQVCCSKYFYIASPL